MMALYTTRSYPTFSDDERCYRMYVHKFLKNRSRVIWPKNATQYAISQYKARCSERIELQAYEGAHLTRPSPDPPPNLEILMKVTKGSYEV